jgi:diguanylate cyclase (GGDEF)-like protein/PAS domain S-box-containing protein
MGETRAGARAGHLSQQQAAALWESLVANSPDIITVHDERGRVVYASPSALRFFGQAAEGRPALRDIFQVIHEDDRPRVMKEVERMRDPSVRMAGPVTFRIRVASGEWRWVESTACNLLSDKRVGAFLVTSRDVTDVVVGQDKLRQSELRYEALVEHSPLAVLVVAEGSITYANPAAARLLGFQYPEQLQGMELAGFVDSEDRARIKALLGSEDPGPHAGPVPARFVSIGGRTLDTETSVIPIPGTGLKQVLVRDVTEEMRARAALEYQAMHDSLTGLPNKALFMDRLAQAISRAQRFGGHIVVMLADIDRFKLINDTYSHSVGDRILLAVAERIKQSFRPTDTVARFGGDEFVVLCEDTEEMPNIGAFGERLLRIMSRPVIADGSMFHVEMSVGITESRGFNRTPDDLLKEADSALARAKEKGRGRYEIFDEETGRAVAHRMQVESELRQALQYGELRVFYQPVVDITTGEVHGLEALVRWQHPRRGLVGPMEFIPVAEETGLIMPLGRYVLREALAQLKQWEQLELPHRPIVMSVNLSGRQLLSGQFLEEARALLEEFSPDPALSRIELEVTESVIMADRPEVSEVMASLRELGIGIVIDDFGTGYSSFSYLKRFPVQMLKIDKSFVSGLRLGSDDEAIISAIIQLARVLGIDVVAEGVETLSQLLHLRNLGCRLVQGFYFSRPEPSGEVEKLIKRKFNVPAVKV